MMPPAFEEWAESAPTRFRTQATHSFLEAAQELLALSKTMEALEAAVTHSAWTGTLGTGRPSAMRAAALVGTPPVPCGSFTDLPKVGGVGGAAES